MGRVRASKTCTPVTCNSTNASNSTWFDQSYTYDLAGDPTSYSDGFGTTISENYDGGGRLSSVTSSKVDTTHPATLWTANTYSALGLTQATLGNGVIDTRQYDSSRGWIQSRSSVNQANQTLYSEGLTYYHNGSVESAIDTANGNWGYEYDSLNRLYTAVSTNTGRGCKFTYDSFGNKKEQVAYQGTCLSPTFSFSAANNRIDGYCYDAAGRLLDAGACPAAGVHHQFTYDGYGNLLSANYNSTDLTSYTVDAYGRRVAKFHAGSVEHIYLYDLDGDSVAEMDGSGNWLQTNIRAGGQFLAQYKGNETQFLHTDHLGSIRSQSNSTGTQTESCSNFPFGDGLSCSASSSGYRFTGKERDAESDLDNFGARYFGSAMGRFVSPDTYGGRLADPQSLNKFAYVRNNPLIYIDPDGHDFNLIGCGDTNTTDCRNNMVGTYDQKGNFTATVISNDKNGNLVDKAGNLYSGTVTSSGVTFAQAGSSTSYSGTWINGSNSTSFTQSGGALNGFQFTFSQPNISTGQTLAGSFHYPGTFTQAGDALEKAGFGSSFLDQLVNPVHGMGNHYRGGGNPQTGADTAHFVVDLNQLLVEGGNLPFPIDGPTTGDFHFGETDPRSVGGFYKHVTNEVLPYFIQKVVPR